MDEALLNKIIELENLVVNKHNIPRQEALELLKKAEDLLPQTEKNSFLYSKAIKLIIFIKGILIYEPGVKYRSVGVNEFGSISRILLEEQSTLDSDAIKDFLKENKVYNENELLKKGFAKIKIEEVV